MKPILENNNIKLLPLTDEHRESFITLANIPEINRRINKPPFYTDTHFDELLKRSELNDKYFIWMIEHSGEICGVINTAPLRHTAIFQGGYWVNPAYWGKGIAPNALSLVKDFLLNELKAERIQAIVEPDNQPSIRVLEKCGYEREGLLRKFHNLPSR